MEEECGHEGWQSFKLNHEFAPYAHAQAVDAALEEARFEERVGGSFADRADDKLFRYDYLVIKSWEQLMLSGLRRRQAPRRRGTGRSQES